MSIEEDNIYNFTTIPFGIRLQNDEEINTIVDNLRKLSLHVVTEIHNLPSDVTTFEPFIPKSEEIDEDDSEGEFNPISLKYNVVIDEATAVNVNDVYYNFLPVMIRIDEPSIFEYRSSRYAIIRETNFIAVLCWRQDGTDIELKENELVSAILYFSCGTKDALKISKKIAKMIQDLQLPQLTYNLKLEDLEIRDLNQTLSTTRTATHIQPIGMPDTDTIIHKGSDPAILEGLLGESGYQAVEIRIDGNIMVSGKEVYGHVTKAAGLYIRNKFAVSKAISVFNAFRTIWC